LREEFSMEKALEKIAEQILSFDEASLIHVKEKYRLRIENFDGTKDWEKAVIAYCMINAVSMKNMMFNEKVLKRKRGEGEKVTPAKQDDKPKRPNLKRIK
jgi:hypothetical protein